MTGHLIPACAKLIILRAGKTFKMHSERDAALHCDALPVHLEMHSRVLCVKVPHCAYDSSRQT